MRSPLKPRCSSPPAAPQVPRTLGSHGEEGRHAAVPLREGRVSTRGPLGKQSRDECHVRSSFAQVLLFPLLLSNDSLHPLVVSCPLRTLQCAGLGLIILPPPLSPRVLDACASLACQAGEVIRNELMRAGGSMKPSKDKGGFEDGGLDPQTLVNRSLRNLLRIGLCPAGYTDPRAP